MKNLHLILATLLLCVVIFSCSNDDSDSNPETGSDTFSNTLTINNRTFTPDSLFVSNSKSNNVAGTKFVTFDLINRNPDNPSKKEFLFIWVSFDSDSLVTGTYKTTSFGENESKRMLNAISSYEVGTLDPFNFDETKKYEIDNSTTNSSVKIIDHGENIYTLEIDAYFEHEEEINIGSDQNPKEVLHVKGVFKNQFKDAFDLVFG